MAVLSLFQVYYDDENVVVVAADAAVVVDDGESHVPQFLHLMNYLMLGGKCQFFVAAAAAADGDALMSFR